MIASHTRYCGPSELNLEHYSEALSDAASGLTYPAFVDSRKQSVMNAEQPFNPKLAEFMERNGYIFEVRYIRNIWNWRRACDEHGLSSLECLAVFEFDFVRIDALV